MVNLVIIILAYSFSKLGYMILYNNFFYLVTLKGKNAAENWLEKFGNRLGYTLLATGFFTALLLIIKKYFADDYMLIYGIYLLLALVFLIYNFFSLRRKAKRSPA